MEMNKLLHHQKQQVANIFIKAVVVIGEGEAEVAVEQLHLQCVRNLLLLAK